MAGFALKIKCKGGQNIVKGLTSQSTATELKKQLSDLFNLNPSDINVLSGFPPKPVDLSDSNITLEALGISSGDTLIVEEKLNCETKGKNSDGASKKMEQETQYAHIAESQLNCPGILLRKVVPSDNSCLFTSVGYVLSGKVDPTCGQHMRKIIAEAVRSDPETYSEAILGKPNKDYCSWIQKPDSWGGAIELSILSNFYGIEMAVVDTINAIVNRFGEDKSFAHRIFLIFDGIHYDPLFLEPLTPDGTIQTMFPVEDESMLEKARQLALEAQSSRQFTDVDKFTLKCLICQSFLKGQNEAQVHAKETGHMNFGEVAA
ncbi:Ubiquitin thioesterase OTU1 [Frankliniella fusca]|uniref:Ubiquitin thioesterase OTU n=1 Tax=Frankliniella fusca TaxID=407009 RepID=A0AAE1I211_9NEOP|nr:Ubiquitin thioesterase OTU1 [Frankliniella fusca]